MGKADGSRQEFLCPGYREYPPSLCPDTTCHDLADRQALIVCMAQIGSFVPASSVTLAVHDAVQT
jgi:hypothetical protein